MPNLISILIFMDDNSLYWGVGQSNPLYTLLLCKQNVCDFHTLQAFWKSPTSWICLYGTLLKSFMESYPVERAQSLVETRLMSPSFSEAVARAAVSSGFPVRRTYPHYNSFLPVLLIIIKATKKIYISCEPNAKQKSLTHTQPPGLLCRVTPLDLRLPLQTVD